MRIKFVFSIFIICIAIEALLSQKIFPQVNQMWVARYNATFNGSDFAQSIALDKSGNIYVTGYSWVGWPGGYTYSIIKYNSAGVQKWVQQYGQTGGTISHSTIATDVLGHIYVACESMHDYTTLKYDTSGVLIWAQIYNGPSNDTDIAYAIKLDKLGNIYVTGTSVGNGSHRDYATVKYNTFGVQQWVSRYNGKANGVDCAYSLAVDDSGSVYVTGASEEVVNTNEMTTVKYNSSGAQQWVRIFAGDVISPYFSYNIGNAIATDSNGDIYVTGVCTNLSTGTDCVTIKYSSYGIQQWVKLYKTNYDDEGKSIAIDDSNNIFISGISNGSTHTTQIGYLTIKYNSTGVQQWAHQFNDTLNGEDHANSIALDRFDNVYIAGTFYYNYDDYDYGTIKYSSTGNLQWAITYDGPIHGRDRASSIAVDTNCNVYVTGTCNGGYGTGDDYCTIKYSQLVGIHTSSNKIPKKYTLYQNYPNPFNGKTVISYQLPLTNNVLLVIYDILGREVKTLVNEKQNAGSHQIEFNGSNLSSGIYFYKLEAGNIVQVKKMLLIK